MGPGAFSFSSPAQAIEASRGFYLKRGFVIIA